MERQGAGTEGRLPIVALIPNLVTVAAICAGLTAIRLGVQRDFEGAVLLVFLAAALDGLDGRLARALKVEGRMGAELDSLGDFLNFGVAPALILYSWSLQSSGGAGWIAVLVYAVCCVLRLARFNVASRDGQSACYHFVGVPAPAGALMVMLPLYLSFAFFGQIHIPNAVIIAYMAVVGLLMISTLRTPSFKSAKINRGHARYVILGVAILGAALVTYVWEVLIAMCLAYAALLVHAAATTYSDRRSENS